MKKIFLLISTIILALLILYTTRITTLYKVFKIVSPNKIYIDLNNNYIFDERNSVTIKDIYYLDNFTNLYKYPYFKDLSEDEVFFISYKSNSFAKKLLNNQFVAINNGEIFINRKNYKKLLLESHLFFDDSELSQKKYLEKLKSYNLNNYVIYNTRSKVYHKLNCEKGRLSNNYKIIKISDIKKFDKPCSYCILPEEKTQNKTLYKNSFAQKNIEIFFTDLNQIMKPSKKCSTKACISLKNEINKSKETIDFAVYGFNNQPEIMRSLINAQKRGVKIRWVCDYDKKYDNYYPDTLKLKKYLKDFKTDENYDKNNRSAIMHNKFFIFDNKKVWTGSSNITSTDLTGFNANYSILINSEELAKIYTKEFNQMYNGNFHTNKSANKSSVIKINDTTKMEALFSPQDNIIQNKLLPLINNAQKYIYIPIFFLTHKELSQALITAQQRGVDIKIINDATNAHTKHSIHKILRSNGIKVKTENYAGKLHIKSMIIDDKISVLGSMNFTKSANNKNDENILIIYNPDIAKYLKGSFIYLWNKIPAKYEKYDPHAESSESIGSCFDGIDNDFDEKIDKEDEGCFIHQ